MMPKNNERGFLLVSLMITIGFIITAGLITSQLALSNLQTTTVEKHRVNAQFAADAGIDIAIQNLTEDVDWVAPIAETDIYNDGNTKTTYLVTVVDGVDDTQKFLNVTGRTYYPIDTVRVERKFQVEIRGVQSNPQSVVAGVGGLALYNSSKIVGGDVYVNGTISMVNTAQIGLSTNPVNVKSAHQSCPTGGGASYPTICTSGQPITLLNSSHIYGRVEATNQTNGSGMSNTGLVSGGSAPPIAMPTYDRAAQVAAVSNTVTGSVLCVSGTYTFPANTKVTGDVSIINGCKATVNGDLWISGNLTVTNAHSQIINGSASEPVIMVDGSTGVQALNNSIIKSNNANIGFRIITYWSAASCSPGCSDVTGNDLFNSRNSTTINLSNSSSAPQTEFYARWSKVSINNSGNLGAVVGQTIELTNSSNITFGTSVSGTSQIEAWVVQSYKRTF